MIKSFKNHIRKTKIFWKLRHYLQKDIWVNYYNDSLNSRRNFYSNYIKHNNLNTIFEFGCASGPNLKNINSNISKETFYFGYDISKEAIKIANKNFQEENQRVAVEGV